MRQTIELVQTLRPVFHAVEALRRAAAWSATPLPDRLATYTRAVQPAIQIDAIVGWPPDRDLQGQIIKTHGNRLA